MSRAVSSIRGHQRNKRQRARTPGPIIGRHIDEAGANRIDGIHFQPATNSLMTGTGFPCNNQATADCA